jgi:hypothetical protein
MRLIAGTYDSGGILEGLSQQGPLRKSDGGLFSLIL